MTVGWLLPDGCGGFGGLAGLGGSAAKAAEGAAITKMHSQAR
jgi:hypothetical protein